MRSSRDLLSRKIKRGIGDKSVDGISGRNIGSLSKSPRWRISLCSQNLLQRRLANERSFFLGTNPPAAPGFFLHPSQMTRQCSLCRGIHPIDKQNSVKMVVLVLNRARKKSAGFDLDCTAFQGL